MSENKTWPDWALDILRCPISKMPLQAADADTLDRLRTLQAGGKLVNCGGEQVAAAFEQGLVSRDGRYFYPALDSIPALMTSEAVDLSELASD